MRHLLKNLPTRFSALNQFRAQKFDANITRIEAIYHQAHKNGKASLGDAFRATRCVITAHIYSVDFYFIVFGMSLLLIATGSFMVPGDMHGVSRLLVIVVNVIMVTLIPVALAFVTTPFNLLYSISMAVLTPVHIVLSAIIMSLLEPRVFALMLGEDAHGFWDIFLTLLVIYMLAESYLMLRLADQVSYVAYKKRHQSTGLESILPLKLQGRLISLSAQDHYVEIVTEHGSHLQRMSFAEAVNMVQNEKGMQVHRSHWAACNAMVSIKKSAERYYVKLRSGADIPVAKSRVEQLQDFLTNR